MEKEKDIAFLKYNLQELKTNFQGKQEEVDNLKAENVNIENEVKKMHDQKNELKKKFEEKMKNIALENEYLEKKVDSFGKQMLVSKKSFEDKISSFDDNIDEINKLSAQVTISGKAVEENFNKLNCELKKEREDINSMRNCQEALVEKFNEKEEEIDTLKVTNINIENEMKLTKDQNEELRIHVERENNDLKNKNQLLETKLDSFEKQLVVEKQLLCNNQLEIINVKTQVGEMKKNLIENMKSSQKRSENVEGQLSKLLKFDNSSFASEVNKLKDEVNKANNEIRATRSHVDKTLNKKTNEINKLSARVTTTEKTINKLNTLNDEVKRLSEQINLMKDNQKDINNAMEKVDNLKGHVTNIENILFCDSSDGCTDILIQWKLQNYQYYFDIGKPVYSPIFLTQVKGYCFRLRVVWSGKKKENLDLFLWVCHGSNYDKPLEPFRMPYLLEMVDNNGNTLSKKVSLSAIEARRVRNFTLLPGQNECECGCGFPQFLSMPDLNNYILNDMLSIQCRLTPS